MRSGKFTYQPVNSKTCCPNLAIRLDCFKFRPSTSQLRVARRLNAYLNGLAERGKVEAEAAEEGKSTEGGVGHGSISAGAVVHGGGAGGTSGGSTSTRSGRGASLDPAKAAQQAVMSAVQDLLEQAVEYCEKDGSLIVDESTRARVKVKVSTPRDGHADASSNISMSLAGKKGGAKREVAQSNAATLCEHLMTHSSDAVSTAVVVGPGYVNVILNAAYRESLVRGVSASLAVQGASTPLASFATSERAAEADDPMEAEQLPPADSDVKDSVDVPRPRSPIVPPDIDSLLEKRRHSLEITFKRPEFDEEAFLLYRRYNVS